MAVIGVSRQREIVKYGIYHIVQRAPGSDRLFINTHDYLNFLSILKYISKKFGLEIFNFCLMRNHLHVLLRITKENLSEAMHSLFSIYAKDFNTKYKRKGHVFSGVFWSSLCCDDAYLLACSLYIHINPVKANIVGQSEDYEWSSAKYFTGILSNSNLIKNDFILDLLSYDRKTAIEKYKSLIRDAQNINDYIDIRKNEKAVYRFTKLIVKNIFNKVQNTNFNGNMIAKELDLDSKIEEYRNKKYLKRDQDKEEMKYIVTQLKSRGYTIAETAKILNRSRACISKIEK